MTLARVHSRDTVPLSVKPPTKTLGSTNLIQSNLFLRTVRLVPEMPKNHTFPTSIIRTPL